MVRCVNLPVEPVGVIDRCLACLEFSTPVPCNRRSGQPFPGRYEAFPVEDEGYYWNLSRYRGFRSRAGGRDMAAMLCRRWTTATLRELSARFG